MELNHEIIRSLGMTLIHSLWQGAIVSVIVLFLLGLTGKTNARLRYFVLYSGLMMLLAGFISTFVIIYRNNGIVPVREMSLLAATIPDDARLYQALPLARAGITSWLFGFIEPAYPALALGWLSGFVIIGLRMAGGLMFSRMTLRKGLAVPGPGLAETFGKLRDLLGIRAFPTLRISARAISPMIVGLLKPVVIIPVAAITGLSANQLEAVMIHELAHIRRYDHIMIVLQAVAGQMLFFHPLTWFLLPEIDRERENCCDDFVMKMNNNPINYIKALTMIQEMNLNSAVPVNALTGKSHHLLSRIKRLVKPEMKHSATFRMTVVLLFFATIGISAMTLLITGKPVNYLNGGKIMATIQQAGNLQNDDSGVILNGTANVTTDDKKNGQKKKMKIVFVNDTIKEMTVNGKAVKKSEMKEYEDEIRKIQQEMESSQQELEKVHRQLKEAQEELETAREELKDIAEEPDLEELSEFNKQFRYPHLQEYFHQPPNIILHDSLLNHYFNKENFKNILQNEEFQQEMKKAQEEVRKAAEEMRQKHEQYWRTHKDELWKEMKKAQEEARRSMEEMRKHREFYFQQDHPFMLEPSPAVPPVPEFELRELPEPKEIMPEKPENPDVMAPESPAEPDQKKTESLDSKLRELEEETIDL